MQHLSIVRNRSSREWGLTLIGQTWHTGRSCVLRDISQSFMIICIRSFMTIMCFRQMRLWFWSRKKTEPMGTSITCGCIVPIRCMTNTTHVNKISPFFSGPSDMINSILKSLFETSDDLFIVHPIALYYE